MSSSLSSPKSIHLLMTGKPSDPFRNDDSIMIISADKGNKIIVIDKELYLAKLKERTKDH